MKLIFLLLIALCSSSIALPQKIKEIRSSTSVQTFNEEGELIKMVSYPNSERPEEFTYKYSKDSAGWLRTKTTLVNGSKLQVIHYHYKDSLVVGESIHQHRKFGMTVSNVFYTYDESGRLVTSTEVDSLQNDTTKTIDITYGTDTTTTIELTKTFKTIVQKHHSDSQDYESRMLIYRETGEISQHKIDLTYQENEKGEYERLSWQSGKWTMNGISALPDELFGLKGYALKSSIQQIKNEHGHVVRLVSSTGGKEVTHDVSYEYF